MLGEVQAGLRAADERVDLLIGVASEGAETLERLEASGADVRTMAGDVFTASAPLSALTRLADLDDVASIEPSGELFTEGPPTD